MIDLNAIATLGMGIGRKPAISARFGYWFALGAIAVGTLPTAGCSLQAVTPSYQLSPASTAYAALLLTPYYDSKAVSSRYSGDTLTPAYRLVSLTAQFDTVSLTPITTSQTIGRLHD